jgi:hypothetical protein
MTTTTIATIEYQEFTWQAIKALASKVGVPFHSSNNYSVRGDGYGFSADRRNSSKIVIEGYVKTYGDNSYDKNKSRKLGLENFLLKVELYCLKNNLQFEYYPSIPYPNQFGSSDAYIQIIKAGN